MNPTANSPASTKVSSPADSTLPRPRRLPGDPDPAARLARLIRVDQAGEYGAARIYAGQLSVLHDRPQTGAIIAHMAAQEAEHLATFDALVRQHHIRPTALQPLWHLAGFALGAASALLGERAAMACTVAVEEVIDGHYAKQAAELGNTEPALAATIEKFRQEELEHRDIGLAHEAELATAYPLLSAAVKAGSRAAIWLSERF
jgi:3-demethoxyubiquinol 3-hydroxylase